MCPPFCINDSNTSGKIMKDVFITVYMVLFDLFYLIGFNYYYYYNFDYFFQYWLWADMVTKWSIVPTVNLNMTHNNFISNI